MIVYVVVGNDYPDCAFSSEEVANAYVSDKTRQNLEDVKKRASRRIYWRYYSFEVK